MTDRRSPPVLVLYTNARLNDRLWHQATNGIEAIVAAHDERLPDWR